MSGIPNIFDYDVLRAHRQRALGAARDHDFLLQRVADDLVERLSIVNRTFTTAIDVGAHHGIIAARLRALPGVSTVIEASDVMTESEPSQRILSSPDKVPLAPESVDLAVSALALQTVNDLPGVLAQIRQALQPDGLFLAAMMGGETLRELRHAWLVAEEEITGGISPRVAPFADVRALGGLLQRAGFALPVADSELVTVRYATPFDLMRELKAIGASNMLTERRRVPVTRGLFARAAEIYSETFAGADGRVPATFEIITLTAWAPDESQPKPLRPGSAQVRLADALGTREMKTGDKPNR